MYKNAFHIITDYPLGMLSACYSSMDCEQFQKLPNSTNAVESHNRFGKSTHPQSLKVAMMATYREDMAKSLQIIAQRDGLPTEYYSMSESARSQRSAQQKQARKKRLRTEYVDDAEGPPDKRSNFNPAHGQYCTYVCYTLLLCV